MTQPPDPRRRDLDERRNARIRDLRQQREQPSRRAFQPIILLGWFAGVIALLAVLLIVGFMAFAPTLMAWVEDNPGSIENGIVRDFVRWYQPDALVDEPASDDGRRISVTVTPGSTASDIATLLFDDGLIRSRLAFHYAVQLAGRQGSLQAGTYDLSPSLRPSQIVAALRQEPGVEVEIRIREGWRLEEVVGYLGTQPLTMDLDELVSLVTDPPVDVLRDYAFLDELPTGRSLEGYLYPDTYRVDANATARDIVTLLLDTFERRLTPEITDGIADQGLTIDEAVRVASIVEREAVLEAERPLIAGVYLNRINDPDGETSGLLNADPTLQYALATAEHAKAPVRRWGRIEWWPPLEVRGADVELPDGLADFQTYRTPGLPPSPIAAPRIASLAAVAAADTASGYLYFVAGCPGGERDGSHYFARTNAEQNANIAKVRKECSG